MRNDQKKAVVLPKTMLYKRIKATKGKFFSFWYVSLDAKKDPACYLARTGVSKGVKKTHEPKVEKTIAKRKATNESLGQITLFDVHGDRHKTFNLDRIGKIKLGGTVYVVQ